jgi:hypothetical protein
MKRKTILILAFGLVGFAAFAVISNHPKVLSIEIVGKNGGENGFNEVKTNYCVIGNRIEYKTWLKNPGYSKLNCCSELDKSEETNPILDLFLAKIENDKVIDTTYNFLNYHVEMKVMDKGNFSLIVI